jgi:hypothetical protein
MLEGALEDAGAERVADDQREDGDAPDAAVDGELGRDVAPGEEQAGGKAERRSPREPDAEPGQRQRGGRGAADPEHDYGPAGWVVDLSRVDQRKREQDETGERNQDCDPFVTRQLCGVPVRGREREHGDTGGADRLHERDRCEPERGHVHEPARRLGREADQPASVAEQQRDEPNRSSRREGWHRGGGVVLACVRPVDGNR